MANWRLEKKHEALKHWVQFVRWTESTRLDEPLYREELSNLRAEAEGLLGEYRDPETAYREIVQVEPNSGLAYHKLAESFARSGEWAESAAAYVKALDLEEAIDLPTWLACACSLVQAGDTEGYRKLCDRMLNRFGQSGDVHQIAFLAHICVLAPNALADSGRVVQLAEQRSSMTADIELHRHWSRHILGLAYYRAGQFEKAVATLEAGQIEPGLPSETQASNWLALAMCRHRLGQDGKAAAALETARAILPSARPELGLETVIVQIPQILLHEAETVLREQ
jgi:tetratricopeptide (TPR) repeat protein